MSLITMPASPVAKSAGWKPGHRTQKNRSEWTKRSKTTVLGAPVRRATLTLPPIVGEPNVYAWRAFVAGCEGQANWFRVVACERDQITGVAVTIDGAGQGGRSIATKGWGAAGLKLRAGQFVTHGNQLLILQADVIADAAGKAVVVGDTYVRSPQADGAAVEVRRPWALMAMSTDDIGWSVGIGQNYEISFECEEHF